MFTGVQTIDGKGRTAVAWVMCIVALLVPTRIVAQTQADSARAFFFQLRYAEALASFQCAAVANPYDTESRAWLAETQRRLGRADDALRIARDVLRTGACSSLAHCVIAQAASGNDDTVLVHARAAIACDPLDPNPWLMLWGEGMKQNDPALHDSAIHMMRATGFFTPPALAWGRAELRTLPRHAVLITSGDMDTYPALAVQITEGFRTDVTVLEREHAGIEWTRRFYSEHDHLRLPLIEEASGGWHDTVSSRSAPASTDEQVLHALLEAHTRGKFSRPIALALTVDPAYLASDRKEFRLSGTYALHVPGMHDAPPDTAALRACLDGIVAEEFRGSWTSTRDRSPVRRFYTDGLAEIITELYGTYAGELAKAGRTADADEVRRKADAFLRVTSGHKE